MRIERARRLRAEVEERHGVICRENCAGNRSGQGIGRAIALELVEGWSDGGAGGYQRGETGRGGGGDCGGRGQAAAFALDVSSEESIQTGAKAILERFGKVEILVNNAGITRDGLMLRMKRADWDWCSAST